MRFKADLFLGLVTLGIALWLLIASSNAWREAFEQILDSAAQHIEASPSLAFAVLCAVLITAVAGLKLLRRN